MAENNVHDNTGQKKPRNSKILKIESRLNELVATDPTNEEIYKLLKQLAYIYINQNKYVYGYSGIEDVCHDVAADVWMSVLEGRQIGAWIYYIGRALKLSYIPKQKALEHQIIDASGDVRLQDNIRLMCSGSALSCISDFDAMQRGLLLDSVPGMIDDIMKHIKFKSGTKEYLAIYTNVCINLRRDLDGQEPTYFRIDESLIPYVTMTIEAFKKSFRDCGFDDSLLSDYAQEYDVAFYDQDAAIASEQSWRGQ